MSPASSSSSTAATAAAATTAGSSSSSCLVVAWDLDTTGRRLIDEICQIGAYAVLPHAQHGGGGGDSDSNDSSHEKSFVFSQYVMPYRNPNPGARRSFGIKVVNVGRYRMLKDMATGKILKTKSEVSALRDFIDWLEECRVKAKKDGGVILACHEMNRKFLVPLLLEAVHKYQLFDQFQATVKGFVNGVNVVEKLGSKDVITSHSLRSLCKTVLGDTNPDTNSASDRSKVLTQILAKVTCDEDTETGTVDSSKLTSVVTSVQEEVGQLEDLKGMLDTQSSLRPIFEARLKQKKRSVRDRAMTLRKLAAESGLDFKAVQEAFNSEAGEEEGGDPEEALKEVLKAKIPDVCDEDVEDLAEIVREYFSPPPAAAAAAKRANKAPATTADEQSVDNATNGDADEDQLEAEEGEEIHEETTEQVTQKEAPSAPAKQSSGGHHQRQTANGQHYNKRGGGGGGYYHRGYHQGGRGGGGGGYHHHHHNSRGGYNNGYNQNYYHRPRGGQGGGGNYHQNNSYHYNNQQQHYYKKPYRGGGGGRGGGYNSGHNTSAAGVGATKHENAKE